MTFKGHSKSLGWCHVSRPTVLVVCSNRVLILHRFRDIKTYLASDLEQSFNSIIITFKIIVNIQFSIRQ